MAKLAKLLQAAAGAGGGAALNVEEVFSTYLYEGNASTQAINNGIDLSGEGGLLWIKKRSGTASNFLFGSDRSADNTALLSNTTLGYYGTSYSVSHSSTGFTVPATTSGDVNESGHDYASWTFRKAPKFFDVVTYTGTGSATTISHNLGSVPGCIIVKCTSNARDWYVYHKGANGGTNPEQYKLNLNSTAAAATETDAWNNTAPTSSVFTVGSVSNVNASGFTYVAYLFAHNNGDGEFGPTGDQDIIKCGNWTGTGSVMDINLGFEPQWIIYKRTDATGDWEVFDNMRGLVVGGSSNSTGQRLIPNRTEAEGTTSPLPVVPTPTGFRNESSFHYTSGRKFVYIAIRRGPMAVPESATDVFKAAYGNASGEPAFTSNFPVDFGIWHGTISSTNENRTSTRLTQGKTLDTDSTAAEQSSSAWAFDYQDGFMSGGGGSSNFATMWRRAPGYFDTVCYDGDGTSSHTINHNLGVVPEMMWFKRRDSSTAGNWLVYHNSYQTTQALFLNSTGALISNQTGNLQSTPSDSSFTVGSYNGVNNSSGKYIAYLFATLAGISKVGSYTGNGTSQTIDCGFSSGARFVLIKRATSAGAGWYVFDTERGIVAGNDPVLFLNQTQAQWSGDDYIDPDNSGFQVTGDANGVNDNGDTFIFYAIA